MGARMLAIVIAALLSASAAVAETDDRPEIPFIVYDDLKDLLGGSFLDVWNFKWKDADKNVYTPDLKAKIDSDLEYAKTRYSGFRSWMLPATLSSVKINPKNHLVYLLLVPSDSLHSDADIVYIYDPGLKRFVCKTTVSMMQ
jgi:hypothetical protein